MHIKKQAMAHNGRRLFQVTEMNNINYNPFNEIVKWGCINFF